MIEWIDKLLSSKCKFWECTCCKRAKAQLFKETWITRRKCCFDYWFMVFWSFQGVEKGCIEKEWIKRPEIFASVKYFAV